MSYLISEELLQNQDTWKRTQLRFPPTLYTAVNQHALDNHMSLNTAIISLIDKGLISENSENLSLPEFMQSEMIKIVDNQLALFKDEIEQKVKTLKNLDEKDVDEFIGYMLNKPAN